MGSSMSSIDESKMRSRFGQIKGTPFKENRPTEAARKRLPPKLPHRPRKARRSQEAANHPAGNGMSGQAY
jgi:hypothetical protein